MQETEPTKEGVHYAVTNKLRYNGECERLARQEAEEKEGKGDNDDDDNDDDDDDDDDKKKKQEMQTPEQMREAQILTTVRTMYGARQQALGKKLEATTKQVQDYRKLIKHIESIDGFWGWRRALGIVRYLENVRFYCFFSWWGANLLLQGVV